MVASVSSSNPSIFQSGTSQNNSSKTKSSSNKTINENPFVKKAEKSSANLNFDTSYKIELVSDKLPKTFLTLTEGTTEEKNSDETEKTSVEIKTVNKNEEMAGESRSEINKTTLKSAVKLYTILKGDILLKNHFDLKTGSVNFFA